jgi:hypothetical protein
MTVIISPVEINMSKFNAGKASVLALTAVAILASFLLGKSLTSVRADEDEGHGRPTPTPVDNCNYVCPSIAFSWDTQEVDVEGHYVYTDKIQVVDVEGHYTCPGGWTLNGSICTKKDRTDQAASWVASTYKDGCPDGYSLHSNQCRKWVDTTYTTTTHSVNVQYDKSSDPNKCHRPSDSTLMETYGMNSDAKNHFKDDNPEHLDAVPVAPEGYYLNDEGQCLPNPVIADDGDVCHNIDGVQYTIPEGQHLDATGQNCVNFSGSGPAPRNDEGVGGAVLGASTGQVLGASTMAGTGAFDETLYSAIMSIGATLSAFGLKGLKKAKKISKK